MDLYYLAPKGTYSYSAACKLLSFGDFKLSGVSTIAKIIDIINKDEKSFAILPVENSIEGIVRQTIDNIYQTNTKIIAQLELEINHCLMSKGAKNQIQNIVSHPQALSQCQKYITNNFDKKINLVEAPSTARAVEFIAKKDETYAAIASCAAASEFNLNIIDKNISDIKENKTRFVVISNIENEIKLFNDKKTRTSIVFNTKNEPGALLRVLSIINKCNLNLVYLESRPSKKVFGEYNFFADIDRGYDEIADVLAQIKAECNYYKLLGSYFSI